MPEEKKIEKEDKQEEESAYELPNQMSQFKNLVMWTLIIAVGGKCVHYCCNENTQVLINQTIQDSVQILLDFAHRYCSNATQLILLVAFFGQNTGFLSIHVECPRLKNWTKVVHAADEFYDIKKHSTKHELLVMMKHCMELLKQNKMNESIDVIDNINLKVKQVPRVRIWTTSDMRDIKIELKENQIFIKDDKKYKFERYVDLIVHQSDEGLLDEDGNKKMRVYVRSPQIEKEQLNDSEFLTKLIHSNNTKCINEAVKLADNIEEMDAVKDQIKPLDSKSFQVGDKALQIGLFENQSYDAAPYGDIEMNKLIHEFKQRLVKLVNSLQQSSNKSDDFFTNVFETLIICSTLDNINIQFKGLLMSFHIRVKEVEKNAQSEDHKLTHNKEFQQNLRDYVNRYILNLCPDDTSVFEEQSKIQLNTYSRFETQIEQARAQTRIEKDKYDEVQKEKDEIKQQLTEGVDETEDLHQQIRDGQAKIESMLEQSGIKDEMYQKEQKNVHKLKGHIELLKQERAQAQKQLNIQKDQLEKESQQTMKDLKRKVKLQEEQIAQFTTQLEQKERAFNKSQKEHAKQFNQMEEGLKDEVEKLTNANQEQSQKLTQISKELYILQKNQNLDNECAICSEILKSDSVLMEELKASEQAGESQKKQKLIKENMRFPIQKCGHKNFHKKCILKWFKTHQSCPICRVPVDLGEV